MSLKLVCRWKFETLLLILFITIISVAVLASIVELPLKKEYNADILIENATILTLNNESEIINNGWIAIKEGLIMEVGTGNYNYEPREIINANGKVVMPGLINTHSHVAMTLFRGIEDSSNLSAWLKKMNSYGSGLSKDDVYWGSLLGEIEMIKSGTTTFNDMYSFEESIENSVKKTGMRTIVDIPFYFDDDKNIEFDENFINKREDLFRLSVSPNPLINFSKDVLAEMGNYAKKNNLIFHIHIEEDADEKKEFYEWHKMTPLQMLIDSGLIHQKIVMAHSVNFTESELDYLSQYSNVGVSINPKSNFKLSGSTAPIVKIIDRNIKTGIGTDGAGSSNSLDMFDQINFIAFAAGKCSSEKEYCENKNNIRPEKIIRMATIEGAEVLGLEKEIGSIEVGKKADIIMVDFEQENLVPSYNIYSSLVYSADGSNVSDSIINGVIIMRDRKLLTVDEKEVIEKVNIIAEKIGEID